MKELKGKRVAIIAHDDDFGVANSTTFKAVATALGAQVVAAELISPRIADVTAPLLTIRAANPDVIVSTAYPGPAVLIGQKYGEFGMMKTPLAQAIQGIPVPSVYAKNVGNNAALANFYYGSPLNDLTEGPKQQKWLALLQAVLPRSPAESGFMTYGLPSAMAVTHALEKAGRDLTREKFNDAVKTANFESEVIAGPTAFAKDRRDGARSLDLPVKFDGKTGTLMPSATRGTARPACNARPRAHVAASPTRRRQRHASPAASMRSMRAVAGHRLQVERRHQFRRRRDGDAWRLSRHVRLSGLGCPYLLIFPFGALMIFIIGALFDRVVLTHMIGRAIRARASWSR